MILLVYLLYQVLALSRTGQAISTAPIEPLLSAADGNRTILKTQISPPWVSNTGARGTSDILWSCLVTLTACVYTAIHLNVPPAHEGKRQFFWRKTKWVAMALFAPEIVLYCALTQLLQARKFVKEMNELCATQQASPDYLERQESALVPPNAQDSHSKDGLNVVGHEHQAPLTQHDQAPSDIPLSPLSEPTALETEENIKEDDKEDDVLPVSGQTAGDQTYTQPPQRSHSISSKRSADGQYNSRNPDLEKGLIASPPRTFSLKYGLFVVMGGITTLDVAKIHDDINGPIVLTPDAVIQFARRGVFLDIPRESISAKSKTNLLGKGLVCMQVIWFLIQCIARAAAGYPLALLEVHTMVHVVCALLMYALWWEKPQDISEPLVQDVSNHLDVLAVLFVISPLDPRYPAGYEALKLRWYGKTKLQDPLLERPSNARESSGHESNDPRYEVKMLRKTPESEDLKSFDQSKGQVAALVPGQALNCGIGPRRGGIHYLTAKDVLRWSKVSEWLDRYEQLDPMDKGLNDQIRQLQPDFPRTALADRVSDFPGRTVVFLGLKLWLGVLDIVTETKILLALLVALPLIYGGIHLTTWHFHFASQTEHLLWKIACIVIMVTVPIGSSFYECIYSATINGLFSMNKGLTVLRCITWIFLAPIFVFYALSRIYIVVESFISLRHVPIGVYAAIPWVQAIPHV